jgi:periplasmic iron binding protein
MQIFQHSFLTARRWFGDDTAPRSRGRALRVLERICSWEVTLMRLISRWVLPAPAVLALTTLGRPVAAAEFYVGDPVVKNDLQIVPHYLEGIEMDPMPKGMDMKSDAIHLEVDIHATKTEKHGFGEGAWIPYLTVRYRIEKLGGKFRKTGYLVPMTAVDGPHYASNVALDGEGEYRLTYHIAPPVKAGLIRHVDKATGVADWWQPFDAEWTFHYPSKPSQ